MNKQHIESIYTPSFNRFSKSAVLPYLIAVGFYIAWLLIAFGGLRQDHYILIFGVSFLYFFNQTTRNIALSFGFMILYWISYDSTRLAQNYLVNPPCHIEEPYVLEKMWFGIETLNGILTPNEYFSIHNSTFLDVATAIVYVGMIPVPLAFSFYLFFSRQRKQLIHFMFSFFLVSQFAQIFHYIYPAAAPWYVAEYGFQENFNVPGNPGRLIEFDHYFGTSFFNNMYDLNVNVFAAIPSLHCAFPTVLFFYSLKYKIKVWVGISFVFMASTWFSAVYTNHHYILDVLAGIGTAAIAIGIHQLLLKTKFKDWMEKYVKRVS